MENREDLSLSLSLSLSLAIFCRDCSSAIRSKTRRSSIRNENAKDSNVACVSTFAVPCNLEFFCRLSEEFCENGTDRSRSSRSPARAASIECKKNGSNLGCQMSDVESRMLDVGSRMANLGCRISDVEFRMSDGNYKLS